MATAAARKTAVRDGKAKSAKSSKSSKTVKGPKTPTMKSKTVAAIEPLAASHPNPLPVKNGERGLGDGGAAHGIDSDAAANKTAAGTPKAKAGKHTPLSLVQKIYNTINLELIKLEEQTGLESQDRERASRALSQIVSSLGKASGMQTDIKKASKKGAKKVDTEALAHAETLRREIAERVDRIGRGLATRKRDG